MLMFQVKNILLKSSGNSAKLYVMKLLTKILTFFVLSDETFDLRTTQQAVFLV